MLRIAGFLLLPLVSMFLGAQNRMISHVTSSTGGFTTNVILENDSVDAVSVTLTPFDSAGNVLSSVTLELDGRTVIDRSSSDLFDEGVSHFQIDGNVRVGVHYNFQSGNGSPAFVTESGEQATRHRLFPGNWDAIFDGIAVVNTGDVATDVWIAQRDAKS